jgi:hypothetical protein
VTRGALERNLERLLTRAYQPVVPRESFRAALAADVHARARRLARGGRPRALPARWGIAAVLAAAALVLIGAAWLLRPPEALDALLGRGAVAWRTAPTSAWRGSAAEELEFRGGFLELATPEARGATVRAGGGRVELASASRAVVSGPAAQAALLLGEGGAAVEPGGGPALWVDTSEGRVLVAEGRTLLDYRAEAGRRLLRVEVERGSARASLAGAAGGPRELALSAGDVVRLSQGSLVEPGPAAAAAGIQDPAAGARAVPAAGEPPAAAGTAAGEGGEGGGGAPVQVRGTVAWVGADPAAPEGAARDYQVIFLRKVALPDVAEPRVFAFSKPAFEVGGLEPGTYDLFARARGRALWRGGALEIAAGGAAREIEVELAAGARLEGLVVDHETGLPVADALVVSETDAPLQILALSGPEAAREAQLLPWARTGPDGGFALEDLGPGAHRLRATAPGYGPTWLRVPDPETAGPVEIALMEGGRVEGTVSDAAGSPLDGCTIILSAVDFGAAHPVMSYALTRSGPDGSYALEDLPAGNWALLRFGRSFEGGAAEPELVFVQVEPGRTTRRDFAEERATVRLAGTLALPGGAPAPGRALWLTPAEPAFGDMASTTTDAAGRFAFEGLTPRRYGLFITRGMSLDMVLLGNVDLSSGADVLDHRVVLPSGGVAGRALDGATGAPLARAVVLLLREEPGRAEFAGKTFTDEGGRFAFAHVHPGGYEVQVLPQGAPAGSAALAAERQGAIAVGADEAVELDPVFLYPGGALELTARAATGEPAAGVPVELRFEGRRYFLAEDERTDAQGMLRVVLKPGTWSVTLGGAGFEVRVVRVDVPRAEAPARVTVELERR